MSGTLRRFGAEKIQQLHRNGAFAFQLQPKRNAGDLPVKTNKYIEDWATYRENLEDTFKFDGPTVTRVALWAFGAPVLLYTAIVSEFNKADAAAGRKKKDFM